MGAHCRAGDTKERALPWVLSTQPVRKPPKPRTPQEWCCPRCRPLSYRPATIPAPPKHRQGSLPHKRKPQQGKATKKTIPESYKHHAKTFTKNPSWECVGGVSLAEQPVSIHRAQHGLSQLSLVSRCSSTPAPGTRKCCSRWPARPARDPTRGHGYPLEPNLGWGQRFCLTKRNNRRRNPPAPPWGLRAAPARPDRHRPGPGNFWEQTKFNIVFPFTCKQDLQTPVWAQQEGLVSIAEYLFFLSLKKMCAHASWVNACIYVDIYIHIYIFTHIHIRAHKYRHIYARTFVHTHI